MCSFHMILTPCFILLLSFSPFLQQLVQSSSQPSDSPEAIPQCPITFHLQLFGCKIWLQSIKNHGRVGVGMSPHRIGGKIPKLPPKLDQKNIKKITKFSSISVTSVLIKFNGARPI